MKSLKHDSIRRLIWLFLSFTPLVGCQPGDTTNNTHLPVAHPQTVPAQSIAATPYMLSDGRRVTRQEAAAWLRAEGYAGRPAIARGEGMLVYVTPPEPGEKHFLVSVSTPNGIQADAARALPVWIGDIFGSGVVVSDAQRLTGSVGMLARVTPAR